jgi:hypothetical protein
MEIRGTSDHDLAVSLLVAWGVLVAWRVLVVRGGCS